MSEGKYESNENRMLSCNPVATVKEKTWEYQQYYTGERDKEGRRSGKGENTWTGAKSLEWYTGRFIRNTMHGIGDYHWRFLGPQNAFITYEGYFYCNSIHGYGIMSYPDGRTFSGLYSNNVRFGPGVASHSNATEDVGIWRGDKLIRLTWRPEAPSIIPDLLTHPNGRLIVESSRTVLTSKVKSVGEVNSALELLKQNGADPLVAVKKWIKLYPKNCTDLASKLCQVDVFDRDYYKGKIYTLEEVQEIPDNEETIGQNTNNDNLQELGTFYAWNDSSVMLNVMKHCYKHERQREISRIDLKGILSGPRSYFKAAGNYEFNCRSLLLASYLGYVADVAELINTCNIHPDISDIQGNTAIIYAAVGDQREVIHFLVEAGANVDCYNDCCCTPLGVVLMRYACTQRDIAPNAMIQALLPSATVVPTTVEPTIVEWKIVRELKCSSPIGTLNKSPSKTVRTISTKKIKSLLSIKDQPMSKRRTDAALPKVPEPVYDSEETFTNEKRLHNYLNREYAIKITDVLTTPVPGPNVIPYIFEISDMVREIEALEEDQKKTPDKNPKKVTSKLIKDTIKTSKDMMWQNNELQSIDSEEKLKIDKLSQIMQTMTQLLSDGANPKLVRCPQPALFIAIMSNNCDIIRNLIRAGADINEVYPQVLNYTPLDIAISRPYSSENFEVVKTLLECGADTRHVLKYQQEDKGPIVTENLIPGPTLLHAILARKVENVGEEDVRRRLLELFLQYNCDPIVHFKGSSAIDVTMNHNFELLDVFIKNPKSNLNAKINNHNQSILVKMFSNPFFRNIASGIRLQTFTNLLSHGADPLIECQNGKDVYTNIFVFAKKTFLEMENTSGKVTSLPVGKQDSKAKKPDKPKKDEKLSTKSVGKMAGDDIEDYKQAIQQVTDCARLIYIRWLQARVVKDMLEVIDRYKHRQWNMILKELKNTRIPGLWLTPQRTLEIWSILSKTKNKAYNNKKNLRHLLCISIYVSWKSFEPLKNNTLSAPPLNAALKNVIETDVTRVLRQYRKNFETSQIIPFEFFYVKPELTKDINKFNICFECALPLEQDKILCSWCKLISFCSYECIKMNINRASCHPCSDLLKLKYFPSPDVSDTNI